MIRQLRVCAVGDIAFEGAAADRPTCDFFAGARDLFHGSDLVIGNLEGPLTADGEPIPGKCVMRGSPGWASVMRDNGVGIVSLANNHTMDYGEVGLASTLQALADAGIKHFGAGPNRQAAYAPLLLERSGRRLAILGRSAVEVSAPVFAGASVAGVAWLDRTEILEAVRASKERADIVLVVLHWGLEDYHFPSPLQRGLASEIVAAGAAAILGHHPHVLQGAEVIQGAPVVYSLGNFAFSDFDWSYTSREGRLVTATESLQPENRRGAIAVLEWMPSAEARLSWRFTTIARDGRPTMDSDPLREPELGKLSTGLHRLFYAHWWRAYSVRREWQLRLGARWSPRHVLRNLHRLRLRHLSDTVRTLLRSSRIVFGRSTNPYD